LIKLTKLQFYRHYNFIKKHKHKIHNLLNFKFNINQKKNHQKYKVNKKPKKIKKINKINKYKI